MDIENLKSIPNEHVLDTAARLAGGRLALATLLGVSTAAIGNWKLRGNPPIEHCLAIERATAGVVTRLDLRPSDWQRIWPDLAVPGAERSYDATEVVASGVAGV